MRINKLLSNYGLCSRKEANKWIEEGRIQVNGELCTPGQWIELSDEILLDGNPIKEQEKVYLILNKPVGITCTAARNIEGNIIDFLNFEQYIFPVGRLDKESEGLILMTNDGELANRILEADNHHEKEYIVTVDKKIDDKFINGMAQGVKILGVITRPCKVKMVDDYTFKIILTQGLNRQIRRMVKTFGLNVTKLKRIRILSIELSDLETGGWRKLSKDEIQNLKRVWNK
ncbi:pseudouridine synthase [Clostridium culturomicium]|uniref:pseudouridine synthase n=1 Tax=Clostridium culturomicium TaxID=1499683 RepID=UPI00058C4032|nr:pseudouridine synthase [Clostridium culturomicium]